MLPGSSQANTDLGDEIYCQLMKQTTNNPRVTSSWRGWQLIAAVAAVAPPSEHLMNYVVGYMVSTCKQTDICGALATFSLRVLVGSDKIVTDETLNEASRMIPAKSAFEGSVGGVVWLEATQALLYSQSLLSKGSGDYGAVSAGIKGKGALKSSSTGCASLHYRDLVTFGANFQKKNADEKNYSDRWLQLSPDLKYLIWKKNVKDKSFKSIEISSIEKISPGPPKVHNLLYHPCFVHLLIQNIKILKFFLQRYITKRTQRTLKHWISFPNWLFQ